MNIAVIGSGQMGFATVLYLLRHTDVKKVLVIDINSEQLITTEKRVSQLPQRKKLSIFHIETNNTASLKSTLQSYDVIATAIPWQATQVAIDIALNLNKPLVSITRPKYEDIKVIQEKVDDKRGTVILGCGLEPGLTEICARYASDQFMELHELHIRCGGIPLNPKPPLFYKSTFTSNTLPIEPRTAYCIKNGILTATARFSDIEHILVNKLGLLEAWHDGMLPWLLELPGLKHVNLCTQKTLRWPGFATRIQMLGEMGLLNNNYITVDGMSVRPKRIIETLLKPHTDFTHDDRDIVILAIKAIGKLIDKNSSLNMELIDYYDEKLGITAMARMTGYMLGISAFMVGNETSLKQGLLRPENFFLNHRYHILLDNFSRIGIKFKQYWETT
jgi:lysine 6-dehydrogenase